MHPGSYKTQAKNKNSRIFSQFWGRTGIKKKGFKDSLTYDGEPGPCPEHPTLWHRLMQISLIPFQSPAAAVLETAQMVLGNLHGRMVTYKR
jgi:hypothetical protein